MLSIVFFILLRTHICFAMGQYQNSSVGKKKKFGDEGFCLLALSSNSLQCLSTGLLFENPLALFIFKSNQLGACVSRNEIGGRMLN